MCGYAGFYNPHKKDIVWNEATEKKLDSLVFHRGPDAGQAFLHQDNLFYCLHRRLKIVDLSEHAAQPMFNETKTKVLVYNGELYNNAELRKELEAEGIQFQSTSDTETLLAVLEYWGLEGLHRINGMFSFAYFDLVQHRLWLVRDRFGIKPLYIHYQDGLWSFASELKAFHAYPWISFDINPHSVDHYLTFMTAPAPLTLYKHMYKVPAGHYFEIDAQGRPTVHQWYSPLRAFYSYPSSEYVDEETCIETARYLLKQSVKEHLYADVPVGAFLSGGIDSSLNVALMAEHTSKIKTFTVAMEQNSENELEWARKIADQFGTDHHELIVSEQEALDFYQTMIEQVDEPLADSVNIPFYFVAKKAREAGIIVAQVGEAADELFFGYPVYQQYARLLSLEQGVKSVPAMLKKAGASLIKSLLPYHAQYNDVMQSLVDDKPLFLSGAVAFHPYTKKQFLPSYDQYQDDFLLTLFPEFLYQDSSFAITQYHLNRLHEQVPQADVVQKIMYLELSNRLPDLLLMRADKMSMLPSVEARVPFLDHRLVEYMFAMPEKFKTNGYQRKYLLKKVARGIIPDEIIDRKKVGFAAPVTTWMEQGSSFYRALSKQGEHQRQYQNRYVGNYHKLAMKISPALRAVQNWTLQNLLTTVQKQR